jgi:2,3-bisphosphoglycerate-dependent phosphoglycerate mutase/probable phosphoglycerate mutase
VASLSLKDRQAAADIWLVRHTETDWNHRSRYQSRSDRPLTRRGRAHLGAVAGFFRDACVTQVVSSGISRTDRLGQVIADQHPHAALLRDARWAEVDHGRWEGLTHSQVIERFGDGATKRFRQPARSRVHGGETLYTLAQRVSAAWEEVLRSQTEGCVVVAHATPIQVLLCRILHMPLDRYWQIRIHLGGITCVQVHKAGARLGS